MSFLKRLSQCKTYYFALPNNKNFAFLLSRNAQTIGAAVQHEKKPILRNYLLLHTFDKHLNNELERSETLTNKKAILLLRHLSKVIGLNNNEKTEIIEKIENATQKNDIEFINALLDFYNENKLSFDLNTYLKKVEQNEIETNAFTYEKLIEALCLDSQVEKAQQLLAEAISNNYILNSMVYGDIIAAYCRSGKIKDPINALETLEGKGVRINYFLVRKIINGLCRPEQEECLLSVLDYSKNGNIYLNGFDLVKIALELKDNNNTNLLPKILPYFNVDDRGFGYTLYFLKEHNEYKKVLLSLLEEQCKPIKDSFLAEPVYNLLLDNNAELEYGPLSEMFLQKDKCVGKLLDVATRYKRLDIVKSCLIDINDFNYKLHKAEARRLLTSDLSDDVTQFLLDKNIKLQCEDVLGGTFWHGQKTFRMVLAANRLYYKKDVALKNYFEWVFSNWEMHLKNEGYFLYLPQKYQEFDSEVYTKALLEFIPRFFDDKRINSSYEGNHIYVTDLKDILKRIIRGGKFLPTNKDEVQFTKKLKKVYHPLSKLVFSKSEKEVNNFKHVFIAKETFSKCELPLLEFKNWLKQYREPGKKGLLTEPTINDWINYILKSKDQAKFKLFVDQIIETDHSYSQSLVNKLLMRCIEFGDDKLIRKIHESKLVDDSFWRKFHLNSIPSHIMEDDDKVKAMQTHLDQQESNKNASFWCLYFSYIQHGMKEKALQFLNSKIELLSEGEKDFQMTFADPRFVERHLSGSTDKFVDVIEQCKNLKWFEKLNLYNRFIYQLLEQKDFSALESMLQDLMQDSPGHLSAERKKTISCHYQLAKRKTPKCFVADNDEQALIYNFSDKNFEERLDSVEKLKDKFPLELIQLHFNGSLNLKQHGNSLAVFKKHFPDKQLDEIEAVISSYFSAQLQENNFDTAFELLTKVVNKKGYVEEVFLKKLMEKFALKALKIKDAKLVKRLKSLKTSKSYLQEKINAKANALITYYQLCNNLNYENIKNYNTFSKMCSLTETIKNEDNGDLVDKLYETAWNKIRNSGDVSLFENVTTALLSFNCQLDKVQANLNKCVCEDGETEHAKYNLTRTFQRAVSVPSDMEGVLASLKMYGKYRHHNVADHTMVMKSFLFNSDLSKVNDLSKREKWELSECIDQVFEPESIPSHMVVRDGGEALKILRLVQHGLRHDTPVRLVFGESSVSSTRRNQDDVTVAQTDSILASIMQSVESEK